MSGIGRLLCVLALGGAMSLLRQGFADAAAAPEWNPVRTHAVQIGPEARRLIVGFRATAGNAVVKSIRLRSGLQSVKVTVAMTSQADVAGLAQRTGLAMARSRQVTLEHACAVLAKDAVRRGGQGRAQELFVLMRPSNLQTSINAVIRTP
jgi:hypothetical protein